jgi:hypothetical protein
MTEEMNEVEDTSVEEPEVQEVESDTPTLEDYQRLLKENQTLKAQKEHFKKKASQPKEDLKINTSEFITREEAAMIAKGYSSEVLEQAQLVAKAKGIKLSEAVEDPLIKAYNNELEAENKRAKAQLGASGGSGGTDNSFRRGMSEEEHRALWKKAQG